MAVAAAPTGLAPPRLPDASTAGSAKEIISPLLLPNAIRSTPQQAPPARPTNRQLKIRSLSSVGARHAVPLGSVGFSLRRKSLRSRTRQDKEAPASLLVIWESGASEKNRPGRLIGARGLDCRGVIIVAAGFCCCSA